MKIGDEKRKAHFTEMRSLNVFLTAALLCLISFNPLLADLIHLKNGDVIEGFFNSQEGSELVFDTYEGKIRVPAHEVTKMEVGYTGVPVCYQTTEQPNLNCNAILHSVSSSEALIVPERGSLERQKIPMNQIKYLKFNKENGSQKVIPILARSLRLRMVDGKTLQGTITRVRSNSINLQKDDGENITIDESDLKTAYIFIPGMEPAPELKFHYTKALPGYYQFTQGRYWTGSTILFLLASAAGGGASETYLANRVDNDVKSDLLYPILYPYYALFNSDPYYNRFKRHQDNQRAIGAAAAVVYLYHLYDVRIWRLEPDDPFPSMTEPDETRTAQLYLNFSLEESMAGPYSYGPPGNYFGISMNIRF